MVSNYKQSNKAAKIGRVIIPIFVMCLIVYEARNIFKEINLEEVWRLIVHININHLIVFLTLSVISILCLCGYDVLLMSYYNYRIKTEKIFKIAWISASFNNMMGLGGLTGASIRTYLFEKEGISTKELINYNIILVPSTILGLGVLSYFSAFNVFNTYGILHIYKWLWLALIVFCAFIPIYFLLGKIKWLNSILGKFNLFFEGSFDIKLKFTFCSTVDWMSRAILFYAIARSFNPSVSLLSIIGVDVMASVAGLISFIPNGIGSYDIVALMGLQMAGYTGNIGLSIILLFRIFYYIIPWIIGGVLWIFTIVEHFLRRKSI